MSYSRRKKYTDFCYQVKYTYIVILDGVIGFIRLKSERLKKGLEYVMLALNNKQ